MIRRAQSYVSSIPPTIASAEGSRMPISDGPKSLSNVRATTKKPIGEGSELSSTRALQMVCQSGIRVVKVVKTSSYQNRRWPEM